MSKECSVVPLLRFFSWFQRPRKLLLTGDINATTAGPPCPQPDPQNGGVIGTEDCLFLNVFTPSVGIDVCCII